MVSNRAEGQKQKLYSTPAEDGFDDKVLYLAYEKIRKGECRRKDSLIYVDIEVREIRNITGIENHSFYKRIKGTAGRIGNRYEDIQCSYERGIIHFKLDGCSKWLFEKYGGIRPETAKKLTGIYTFRIYREILNSSNGNVFDVELADFKRFIGIREGSYTRWADFNKACLAPAIEDINRLTDITVSYRALRQNRVESLRFVTKRKVKEQKNI